MLRLFEMFAGYGGASFALKKAGIPFECVGYSEVDPRCTKCKKITPHTVSNLDMVCDICGTKRHNYAAQCYEQNHSGVNYGDATQINPHELTDFDLLTGGFPCQAFSIAGKGLGELDTRGTLFNDIIRVAEVKKPKYMLLENVKGLTTKKHKDTFNKILSELDRIGYYVEWKVLNSKNYGIPQNRERVFFVCFRKDLFNNYNEDQIDWFNFPQKEELKIFLKDILELEVDEKYYLSEKMLEKITFKEKSNGEIANLNKGGERGSVYSEESKTIPCLCATDYKQPKQIIQLNNPKHSNDRVYDSEGVSPSLNTMQGGNRQPFILIKNATKKGYLEAYNGDRISIEQVNSKTRRGRVQEKISPTLQCNDLKGVVLGDMQIRKLTPTECFRLMGFLDDSINLDGISNSQRYKLAGNGWDINLVSKIFKEMLK